MLCVSQSLLYEPFLLIHVLITLLCVVCVSLLWTVLKVLIHVLITLLCVVCVSLLWTVLKVLIHVLITLLCVVCVSMLCEPSWRCWYTFWLLCYALSVCVHAVWTVLKAMIHEPFRPYGWGGPFQLHAVGPVRPERTQWLPHDTAEIGGLTQGEADVFNLAIRVTDPCDLWLYFIQNSGITSSHYCYIFMWANI